MRTQVVPKAPLDSHPSWGLLLSPHILPLCRIWLGLCFCHLSPWVLSTHIETSSSSHRGSPAHGAPDGCSSIAARPLADLLRFSHSVNIIYDPRALTEAAPNPIKDPGSPQGNQAEKRAKGTRGVAPSTAAGHVVRGNGVGGSCRLTFHGTHSALSGRGDPDLDRGRSWDRGVGRLCVPGQQMSLTRREAGAHRAVWGVAARWSMAVMRTPTGQNSLDFKSAPCSPFTHILPSSHLGPH